MAYGLPYGTVRAVPGQQRIDRETWAEAGYHTLISTGPQAVTVEGVARRLGVTKGSFYWHFGSRTELLAAALDRWELAHTQALIDRADLADEPMDRVRTLFELVSVARTASGELSMYSAPGGADSELISEALHRVSHARIAYVAALLRDLGFDEQEATDRAGLALAMVIGRRLLATAVPDLAVPGDAAPRIAQLAVQLITAPGPG